MSVRLAFQSLFAKVRVNPRWAAWPLLAVLLGLAGCQANPVRPNGDLVSADQGLFTWVDQSLTPYLAEQLARHPRFKGEPVLLVAISGADVLPDIDQLSEALRSRLMDSLLETPGVNLHWRPTVRPWRHHRRSDKADCREQGQVHYFIGIDISPVPGGEVRVRVRALDLRDESWVTGFGKHWQGRLSAAQSAAWSRRHPDEYLRGLRVLPFEPDQPDLLAAYLAGNLSCLLRDNSDEERLVYLTLPDGGDQQLRTTLELVGNYLARYQAVQVTDDSSRAGLVLKGKRHTIHPGLHQVWASLRTRGEDRRVDTEAYMRALPVAAASAGDVQSQTQAPVTSPPLLSRPRLVSPRDRLVCSDADPWRGPVRYRPADAPVTADECLALELEVSNEAQLFLLSHRPDAGLRRLLPASCRHTVAQRHPGSGRTRVRIPANQGEQAPGREPHMETFYAVAVSDDRLRRQLETHVGHLRSDCDTGRRPAGAALDGWLARLDDLIQAHPAQADWQAVRVRYRY